MDPQVQVQSTQTQVQVGVLGSPEWYRQCVFYQIYPKSFKDSNNDGIGDLQGIISKLDYLVDLGIGAFWMNPIFSSSMYDNGYDITNYYDIDKSVGTLEDFQKLIEESHKKHIKVMIDFVPGHTSIHHPWFQESRSSRTNPKRDWYIWQDPKTDGSEPNNWLSFLSKERHSVWEYDKKTGQYYLHSNMIEQPDLNWRNPEVKEEMLHILRYWLDLGVDGIRVDTINRLVKDEALRDEPQNPNYVEGRDKPDTILIHTYVENQSETPSLIKEMSQVVMSYGSKLIIGEAYPQANYSQSDALVKKLMGIPQYHGFNFDLKEEKNWTAQIIKDHVESYYEELPSDVFPNFVLGNHDASRLATRLGDGLARIAALLLLTLRGAPFIYNGDELGLHDSTKFYSNRDPEKRDVSRTPYPWDITHTGGFSDAAPWLPLDESHIVFNVEEESTNPYSMLSLYKTLISYRNTHDTIREGRYIPFDAKDKDIYGYYRILGTKEVLILLNFSSNEKEIHINFSGNYRIVLNTFLDTNQTLSIKGIGLRPHEGVLMERIS